MCSGMQQDATVPSHQKLQYLRMLYDERPVMPRGTSTNVPLISCRDGQAVGSSVPRYGTVCSVMQQHSAINSRSRLLNVNGEPSANEPELLKAMPLYCQLMPSAENAWPPATCTACSLAVHSLVRLLVLTDDRTTSQSLFTDPSLIAH